MIDENILLNRIGYSSYWARVNGGVIYEYIDIKKLKEIINEQVKRYGWISVNKRLPNENCRCYITAKSEKCNQRFTRGAIWSNGEWFWENGKPLAKRYEVIAWQKKWYPEPYEGE